MPGRTWRDLQHKTPSSAGSAPNPPSQQANRKETLKKAADDSPRLASLMEQRKELEKKFQTLLSGGKEQLDPRDAARFQVPTFAERRAQQREWESRRDALQQQATNIRMQARQSELARQAEQLRRSAQKPETLLRNKSPVPSPEDIRSNRMFSSQLEPVTDWLARHDAKRNSIREAARDRLAPLDKVAATGRQLHSKLSSTSEKLRDLDRQLAEKGMHEERDELKKLGADKLDKATKQVDKYTKMAEAPSRAVKNIDRFWESRRDAIKGPMDEIGPYVERSKRRLSTDTGGSGDLFKRMEENRKRALQKRKEQQRQEQQDEARRERARRLRREEEQEKV